jgi:hypothetical protein
MRPFHVTIRKSDYTKFLKKQGLRNEIHSTAKAKVCAINLTMRGAQRVIKPR